MLVALAQPSFQALGLEGAFLTLTEPERDQLLALAGTWGMDADERAVMLRQCERGGQTVDGSRITPAEARQFWFAEATRAIKH